METDYKNMTRNILYPAADMPATWSTLWHDHTCYNPGHGRCSTPVADTRNVSLFGVKPHIFYTNLTKYWAEFPQLSSTTHYCYKFLSHPSRLVHGVKKAEVMTIWPAEGAGADVRKLPVFRKLDYVISHLFCSLRYTQLSQSNSNHSHNQQIGEIK